MGRKLKRVLGGASAVGAAVFIGVFWWLYTTGIFPLGLTVILSAINVIVGIASLKMAKDT